MKINQPNLPMVIEGNTRKVFDNLRNPNVLGTIWKKGWPEATLTQARKIAKDQQFLMPGRKYLFSDDDLYDKGTLKIKPLGGKYLAIRILFQKLGLKLKLTAGHSSEDASRIESAHRQNPPMEAAWHTDGARLVLVSPLTGIGPQYLPVPVEGQLSSSGRFAFKNKGDEAHALSLEVGDIAIWKGRNFPFGKNVSVKGLIHRRDDDRIIAEPRQNRFLVHFLF